MQKKSFERLCIMVDVIKTWRTICDSVTLYARFSIIYTKALSCALLRTPVDKIQNNNETALWIDMLFDAWNMCCVVEQEQGKECFWKLLNALHGQEHYELVEKIYKELDIRVFLYMITDNELHVTVHTTRIAEILTDRLIQTSEIVGNLNSANFTTAFVFLQDMLIKCACRNFSGIAIRCIEWFGKICEANKPSFMLVGTERKHSNFTRRVSYYHRAKATLEITLFISHHYMLKSIERAVLKALDVSPNYIEFVYSIVKTNDYIAAIRRRAISIQNECEHMDECKKGTQKTNDVLQHTERDDLTDEDDFFNFSDSSEEF